MAFDAFIKIPGAPGESTDEMHQDWIEVESITHGMMQNTAGSVSTGGSLATGRSELKAVTFNHVLDKSTPKIQHICATGIHLPEVIIHFGRPGGDKTVYYKVKLEDVIITRADVVGTVGQSTITGCMLPTNADLPCEEVELRAARVTWNYTETNKDGSVGGSIENSYDQRSNTGA